MFGRLFGKKAASPLEPNFARGDLAGFWIWWFEFGESIRGRVKSQQIDEDQLSMISDALEKIHPNLVFELGIDAQDRLDLVVSAGGIREAFPAVLALVKAMPKRAGFAATAFRQRQDVQIGMNGHRLSPKDLKFISALDDDGEHMDVRVFVPLPGDADDQLRKQIGFLLLDCTLGEYDVATSLGSIEFASIEQAPANALDLPELAKQVDAMNSGQAKH